MTEPQILISAELEAVPGQEAALRDLLVRTQYACAVEEGALIYQFSASLTSPGLFHVLEHWRSEDSFRAHLSGAGFRAFLDDFATCGRVVRSHRMIGALSDYVSAAPAGTTA